MLDWSHQDKVTSLHTRHTCLAAVLQGRARAHCMLLQLASPAAGLGVDKGRGGGCESYIRVLGGGGGWVRTKGVNGV